MADLNLPDKPTLADCQRYVADMMRERGFDDENVAQRFVLLLEETGEFAKAVRKEVGMKTAGDTTQTEAPLEAADVFIVLLGICNQLGIDLEQAFRDKEAQNKLRSWK